MTCRMVARLLCTSGCGHEVMQRSANLLLSISCMLESVPSSHTTSLVLHPGPSVTMLQSVHSNRHSLETQHQQTHTSQQRLDYVIYVRASPASYRALPSAHVIHDCIVGCLCKAVMMHCLKAQNLPLNLPSSCSYTTVHTVLGKCAAHLLVVVMHLVNVVSGGGRVHLQDMVTTHWQQTSHVKYVDV